MGLKIFPWPGGDEPFRMFGILEKLWISVQDSKKRWSSQTNLLTRVFR